METTHTSLKLSKMLHEAGFKEESDNAYYLVTKGHIQKTNAVVEPERYTQLLNIREAKEMVRIDEIVGRRLYLKFICNSFDILNDLCCTHAKELFGYNLGWFIIETNETVVQKLLIKKYEAVSKNILFLLQLGKKEEAEQIFIDSCILFNKTI